MPNKAEVTIELILHATEDPSKFFVIFEDEFDIKEEDFSIQNLTGHFDNPIMMLSLKTSKKRALEIIKKLVSKLTKNQLQDLCNNVEYLVSDSTLHLRFDKQEFIKGNLVFEEKNPIKVKMYTPIYNKKEIIKKYTELLKSSI